MARKKRKKEEDVDFEMPEFDEAEYLRKEVEGAKAALVTVGYAFVVALASYGLTVVGQAALGGLLGLLSLYGLKHLYSVTRVDLATFDKKIWAGNAAVLIFTWLAFWVLLMNPPISDLSPPLIQQVQVVPSGMDPIDVTGGQPVSVPAGVPVSVRAVAEDNVGVVRVEVTMGNGEPVEMDLAGEDLWSRSLGVVDGTTEVRVEAFDAGGRTASFRFTLSPG